MSETSQKGTVLAFDSVSYLAETFVFIYLGNKYLHTTDINYNKGITIVNFKIEEVRFIFTIMMILSVFLSRLISTFVPPILYFMIIRKDVALTLRELKVFWYSGLIRGIISLYKIK